MSVRLHRASDWTGPLHAACDRMEAARAAANREPSDTNVTAMRAAVRAFGGALLDLDRLRRPGMHDIGTGVAVGSP